MKTQKLKLTALVFSAFFGAFLFKASAQAHLGWIGKNQCKFQQGNWGDETNLGILGLRRA